MRETTILFIIKSIVQLAKINTSKHKSNEGFLIIGLETDLQEKAKLIPAPIGLCYKTAQLARYEIYNTAVLQSSAPNIVDLPSGYSPRGFRVSSAGLRVLLIMRKSVKDPKRFKIFHVQPEVMKILKVTGFDTLLL